MEAGELKDRLILESLTTVQSAKTGQLEESWSTYGTVWAKKETAGGSEGEQKDIVQQQQRINFIIRYNSVIDTNAKNFRVTYDSNILDVESAEEITNEHVRTWMRLKCVYRSNS